ncbi:MAG: LysM peptidoglycan-binding domain-containing protein [Ruminococcaceae bacterium]|nr:LysM peptidoglycan-binding domain-containing protein [Oscillospiraceae bacterium]
MNTRTVLLWHNNGAERIYFAVNPAEISVSRPNRNRVAALAMGGTVNLWGGRGLREVRLTTFLPAARSPFSDGNDPETVLSMLKSWQDSGDPIRLILSGSDINDAFLIEDVTECLREGDPDVWLSITLREYKFKSALAALAEKQSVGGQSGKVPSGGVPSAPARTDERVTPQTYTVKKGDTLWDIACRFFGDGTRWQELAAKNGVSDPRKLQIGQVITL